MVSVFRIRFFSLGVNKPRVNVNRNVRGVNGFGDVSPVIAVVQHAALPVFLHRFRVQILHHVNSTARANLQNAKELTYFTGYEKEHRTDIFWFQRLLFFSQNVITKANAYHLLFQEFKKFF